MLAAHHDVLAVLAMPQLQIIRRIVQLVTVDVMNGFGRKERAT